jgi:hypothetical protein
MLWNLGVGRILNLDLLLPRAARMVRLGADWITGHGLWVLVDNPRTAHHAFASRPLTAHTRKEQPARASTCPLFKKASDAKRYQTDGLFLTGNNKTRPRRSTLAKLAVDGGIRPVLLKTQNCFQCPCHYPPGHHKSCHLLLNDDPTANRRSIADKSIANQLPTN